jgi:hypothetical protein
MDHRMHENGSNWRSVVSDLAGAVTRSDRPLTFIAGAGASLSSDAPSTTKVEAAFRSAMDGRFGELPVRDLLHLVSEHEKQDILAPLFNTVVPYVGYRSLAALGRHRRVHLLNLNWDGAAVAACQELHVPHVVFDLTDEKAWPLINSLPPKTGVAIVHAHGRLGMECRFESLRTLSFNQSETKFLTEQFLSHVLVVVGASIVHDTDFHKLFLSEQGKLPVHEQESQWYFGRPDATPQLSGIRRSLLPRGVLNYCCADDVDFDELMVRLLAGVLDADWDKLRRRRGSLDLPPFGELVWPEPTLLRPLLSGQVVALLGQARLGKSVIAHLLGYLHALWQAPGPWKEDDLPVRTVDGPADAVAALAGVLQEEGRVYVVENPFGSGTRTESNPSFVEALRNTPVFNGMPVVVITSRLGPWSAATGLLDSELPVVKSASGARDWFAPDTLRSYARRIAPSRVDVPDRIESGEIHTPARLRDALLLGITIRNHNVHDDEAEISDKVALLEEYPVLARLCCLARLQEFCPETLPVRDLDAWLGGPLSSVPFNAAVLLRFEFEGLDRFRLAHDTDREAADRYLTAKRDVVLTHLKLGPSGGRLFLEAYDVWEFLAAAARKDSDTVLRERRATLRQWAPQLLAAAATDPSVLKLLVDLEYDAWEIKDLSYELVRLWPQLRRSPAGKTLFDRVVEDRAALGTYAILEACLYMRNAATDEVWGSVYAAFARLVDNPAGERELALGVDALTWRPPPERYQNPSWASDFLRSADNSQIRLALVRFLAGYHSGGLPFLDIQDLVRKDVACGWNQSHAEFAAWLVRWHFIHQSRARAQLARQPWVDKDFLCRGLHPAPTEEGQERVNRLLLSFLDFPEQAGWAFFMGCSLPAIGQRLDNEGKALVRKALGIAPRRCQGVIAAILTYDTANEYARDLGEYFDIDDNRNALLDAMVDGLDIDGFRLRAPRFMVNRDPVLCYADAGLKWENLKQALPPADRLAEDHRFNLYGLIRSLRSRLSGVPSNLLSYAEDVVRRAEAGDLRMLEAAAAARSPTEKDIYARLLNMAANLPSDEPRLFHE